jgi:hypothetical protein
LVAPAFIQPLLARLREEPFRAEMLHGGFGEDAFGAQLDTILADRVSERLDVSLVEAIERSMSRRAGGGGGGGVLKAWESERIDLHG